MDYYKCKELYHSGIKGMKWGMRRFRNEDGTLTEEGKARYGYNNSTGEISKKGKQKMNDDINQEKEATKGIADDIGRLPNQAANLIPSKGGKTVHGDYSKISDEELKKRVNRLNMEEQYARLTNDNHYIKSGGEKAREVLQTVGAVIAISATVADIALKVSSMIKKR